MTILTVFILIINSFYPIELDPALPSYIIDEGRKPQWVTENDKQLLSTRWAIDPNLAKCVQFTYKGSGGNFNNFPTKQACEDHQIFKPNEMVAACSLPLNEGMCTEVPENERIERWYFSMNENIDIIPTIMPATCIKFLYTGCGGNANNFLSELDCKKACQNDISGKAPLDNSKDKENEIFVPNEFDCRFYESVDSENPIVRIVADIKNQRCVLAATSNTNNKRGFFHTLSQCVSTCLSTNLIEACTKLSPDQVDLPDDPDFTSINVNTKYYFDHKSMICKPFESYSPLEIVFDKSKNRFDSIEHCSSYCPATAQPKSQSLNIPCLETPYAGIYNVDGTNGNLMIERWTYHSEKNSCLSFKYGGINGNANNFYNEDECVTVCIVT